MRYRRPYNPPFIRMWFSGDRALSYNALFNFIVGVRGPGKTYWATKWAANDFIKNGNEFVYLRRYDTETQAAAKKFWGNMIANNEFPDHDLGRLKSGEFTIDGKICGYPLSLTKAEIYKSVAFPKVTKIIFDEFIIQNQVRKYLKDEVEQFLDLYETIARMRDVKVFFLANAISEVNPYFLYFDLALPYGKDIAVRNDILLQIYADESFKVEKKKTRIAKMIEGKRYANYAIENVFLQDNKAYIKKKSGNCYPYFVFMLNGRIYGCWANKDGELYISKDHPEDRQVVVISRDDYTEETVYLDNFRNSYFCKVLVNALRCKRLFFENIVCKNACFDLLSRVIR